MADRALVASVRVFSRTGLRLALCGLATLSFARAARADETGRTPQTPAAAADGATDRAPPASAPLDPTRRAPTDPVHPPRLHVEYAQYGVAILALVTLDAGAMCGSRVMGNAPCILGSGGGVTVRGGYRSTGPWYIGGAYAFAKMDSANLLRLGILQQLWAEMRYMPDVGYSVAPFVTWGLGGVTYGSEWGVETGGAMLFAGGGVQLEVSRVAVVGLGIVYKPAVIAGWTDSAGYARPTGLSQFLGLDLQLEIRSETGRR